ncbi:MAG: aminotransferase class I/II-fold pyridoxal phosphate-dependent enzyme [Mycolicibacterium insubricum]|nr:aminotransferase class I/II-fold pyridoxal phosphate-dependent enzyme [Mycobacterium sp.]
MTLITGSTANQIAESVRGLVLRGDFTPGTVLPPIRTLAIDLRVNRNTVAAAYRQLIAAGLAEAQGRRGTAITALPEVHTEYLPEDSLVDLASGNPDPALLPDLRQTLIEMPYDAPLYGASAITERLLNASRAMFEGHLDESGTVVVTHGAVDAVERVLDSFVTRGDTVAVEDPCFLASIGTIRLNGYQRAAVPIDEAGMTAPGLRHAIANIGARAVIITPRAHNPTGACITAERAAELRAVLADYPEVLVIEDDYLSGVSSAPYHRVTPPTTKRWALIRSVAKFLGPDLRLALVATDTRTAGVLGNRLREGKNWVSHLLQSATAHLLTDPDTVTRLRDARAGYRERGRLMIDSLAEQGISVFGDPDGLNVWIDLPDAESVDETESRLAEAHWAVKSSRLFAVDPFEPRHGIRVTTATIDAQQAARFAAALAETFDALDITRGN